MKEIKRYSPVLFEAAPLDTEQRDNWNVVLKYSDEGGGPYLVDLSHRTRLDLQSSDLASKKPFGITIPDTPCQSVFEGGILANRMNRTQTSLYHLEGEKLDIPGETEYTDVTEATIFVAMFGEAVFSICEKLSALDFMASEKEVPFLYQGPFSHVPCQIVTLSRNGEKSGVVLTCSRGYAKDMIHSILDAGEEFGLRPAGESRFTEWIKSLK
ncbi:MAG: sarcosine oxidase subunit gamma SoxG [Deltaproteobacteria bacterium]|nr:sarcosine oxidase subunit gamma SoxG [Deltaproteobacteria bacterium]